MNHKRKALLGGLVLLCGMIALLVIFKRYHSWRYQSTSSVLREMHEYQSAHRYDDAISIGNTFTERFPANGWNDRVFAQMAFLYLEKAKEGIGNKHDDVASALVYRDKILPTAADTELGWYSVGTLQSAAVISETAGDLSEGQQCEQYRSALQLTQQFLQRIELQRAKLSNLHSDKDEFGFTTENVQLLVKESHEAIGRIGDKRQKAGCR